MYYTIEEQKKAIKTKADLFDKAAKTGNGLYETIKKFDGKQYNKRFREALESATENISVYDDSWNFYIEYRQGYGEHVTLVSAETCTCGRVPKDPTKERVVFDGKKIIADKLINLMKKNQKSCRLRANQYRGIADDLEARTKRINTIKEMYRKEVNSLPYEIAIDICGFKSL